ncbi:MAG: hypothetical protein M3082_06505 [Candidatus Dormibacteraeota bacterium]|nr:hypothetical protein [Candidatus Dormibacteraeota bacterium]
MESRAADYEGPTNYIDHLPELQPTPLLVEEFIVGMLDEVIYPGRDVSVIDLSDRVTADRIRDAATALVVGVFTTATSREEMRRRLIDGTRQIASDYQQRWPSTPLALVPA